MIRKKKIDLWNDVVDTDYEGRRKEFWGRRTKGKKKAIGPLEVIRKYRSLAPGINYKFYKGIST